MSRRRLGLLLAALAMVAPARPLVGQRSGADRYDDAFHKYAKRFFGVGFDWRIFKAQGMTESRLDPQATSGVGARGIMQLMPSTFQEIQSRNPDWTSVNDPEWNIAAGIFHDRALWRLWGDEVQAGDHDRFMFASYNAGRIPILTAQHLAKDARLDPREWASVERIAPQVPKWRHRETVDYVVRIRENLARLDARGRVAPP